MGMFFVCGVVFQPSTRLVEQTTRNPITEDPHILYMSRPDKSAYILIRSITQSYSSINLSKSVRRKAPCRASTHSIN